MEKRDKNQTVQLRLRIRESLRARLEKDARRSGISLNAEVERRLEASFAPVVPSDDDLTTLERLVKRNLEAGDYIRRVVEEQREAERRREGEKQRTKDGEG